MNLNKTEFLDALEKQEQEIEFYKMLGFYKKML